MKLYHFTADLFLRGIIRDGITNGVTPLIFNGQLVLVKKTQWLTKNPSFIQPWHDPDLTKLAYDRRVNRLTVKIPTKSQLYLWDWKTIEKKFKRYFIRGFDFHEDRINWFIFNGRIKPSWIREIDTFNLTKGAKK